MLPIGISFYTFQSMSYVIDVYRREIPPTRNLVQFAAFVSFFPHLVAGPIMRPTTLLPQVASPRRFDLQQFYQGCYLIFWGLLKKVVVADNLAVIVNDLFGRWQTLDGGSALLAVYAFAFQIYGDFSGYTDIARGVSKCLGFELTPQLQPALLRDQPQGLLEPVAHQPLAVAAGLPLHLAGRQPRRHAADLPQPDAHDDPGRPLARRGLDLRALGRLPGPAPGRRTALAEPWLERIDPVDPVDRACWKGLRIVATFHLVCLGWLLFRAGSVEQAVGMLSAIVHRPGDPRGRLPRPGRWSSSSRSWSSS